ncbi:MAG: phosphotransferase [Desulfobacteraceae bacterium]|nr:phosphotransferase [Desulfobacteraceae bacterium]
MPQQEIKALVLAAGPGTRLLPHTRQVPKPLFPVAGRPVIDIIIRGLIKQGISAIAVNTHHLHRELENFINSRRYPVPVVTRYEPQMLGTAGAIGNFADFLGDRTPFIVINSDILTDIDIKSAVALHIRNSSAATLILHDCPEFNKVCVDKNGLIRNFSGNPEMGEQCLAFTGIQVVDPVIYDYIPKGANVSSIDIYRAMIKHGLAVRAHVSFGHYWYDLGTPERYFKAVADFLAPEAFKKAFDRKPGSEVSFCQLAGDGSDRRWFRLTDKNKSLVLADHGIQTESTISEFDSYVLLGSHLRKKGLAVPEIHLHDRFSGLVFIKDLGNRLLQTAVRAAPDMAVVEDLYKSAIDKALEISTQGAEGFDPEWCYQEPFYSRKTIVEKEGMYFVRAFLRQWLGMENIPEQNLISEFERIADVIEENKISGFMHRDMQSRNIMVSKGDCYFIDFQGGRLGPIQYDLASLITDPYVDLDQALREKLLAYAEHRLSSKISINKNAFKKGYLYCAVSRNLQALGAYGHLCGVRRKPWFAPYIQPALNNLSALLASAQNPALPCLANTVARARERITG